jgi:chromosome partitioning protein
MAATGGLNFMRTIAFVTQKGGSGKSTLAACLAVAAHEKGERVFLIDTDPLMSLSKWAKTRHEKNIAVEWVPAGKLQSALAMLEKKGLTLAIIDTGAGESPASAAAIKAADLCIIPARPNAFDLWASELTRKACSAARKEFAFLLNQCPPAQQSARIEDGANALEAMGGLLTPLVSTRVDYQEAARHGLGVTELNPQGVAAEEMRDLWASVKRRMARGKSAGVKKAA